MSKSAAIYIRTSSEHQAEKASPEEQERDCRALAELHGLNVVAVYKDVERYRANSRLVDPSGTRSDRPALLRLLADAGTGQFDTILAWKEDRLYRGLRAMLLVLDALQEHKLTVILAKESFDPRMAPVKAWVAGMELESLKERMTMGVKARLRSGKANTGQDRYGYRRVGEKIILVDEEAHWVRQIFEWYNSHTPIMEIRRRLMAAGAPQKGSSVPRKVTWAVTSIQAILSSAKEYADGIKIQTRGGEAFSIPVDRIISEETYQKFLVVRAANKTHPARHVKRDYLIAGLMYCPCGVKWGSRPSSYRAKGVERVKPLGVYYCSQRHPELRHSDCPKTIGSKKADDFVWGKVLEVLSSPALLISGARHYMTELQERARTANAQREKLQQRIDELTVERQWVITQARKGKITSDDMDFQLGGLTMEEAYIKRELSTAATIYEIGNIDNWETAAQAYLEDLWYGALSLATEPETEEAQKEVFEMRRRVVLGLVERVEIGKDRKMKVVFKLDVLSLLGLGSDNTSAMLTTAQQLYQNKSAETCSRTRSSPHPHPSAICA